MSVIRQRVPLNGPWPGADPFLSIMFHRDDYPAADGDTQAPAADLAGREIGADFAGRDGWNMYHGETVPGFPAHPHRGFETVTIVVEGVVDHADSAGATARYGDGDTQWLTAGNGIEHSEMFPLRSPDGDNPLELFQIWLNLAPEDKAATPHFSMLWADSTPTVIRTDEAGRTAQVRVIAGDFDDTAAPTPPPESWAARPDADVAIWVITLEPGATLALPGAGADTSRVLYVHAGELVLDGERVSREAAVVDPAAVTIEAAGEQPTRVLLLQGRPIGAPVVQHGPFVGNSRDDIVAAYNDFQRGVFGSWPWPQRDPVHAAGSGRFARYPDGTLSQPTG